MAWVKEYGEEIEKTFPIDKTKKHGKVIEIDEMWHYVEKKQKLWIWLASKEKRFAIQNVAMVNLTLLLFFRVPPYNLPIF